jgi:hypothetical protein
MKRSFIGTQPSPSIYWEHSLYFSVGSRNDVNTNQFTDATSGCSTGISCSLNSADVTAYKNRYVTCSDIFFTKQLHIRCFDHRVGSLNRANEAFGLNHSECF